MSDLEAIRQLTHYYAHYIDHYELEPLMALWTDDAVLDESGVGLQAHYGRDSIRESFVQAFAVMKSQVHFTSNFILQELVGDRAKGTCYFLVEGVVHGGGKIHATGYYEDEYARSGANWRFKSRRVFSFNPPELGAYQAGLSST